MKKIIMMFLVCIIAIAIFPTGTFASNEIIVTAHGERVTFPDGQSPIVVDGRVLVPLRGVFEALGFDVFWNSEDHFATLKRARTYVFIPVGSDTFSVMGGVSGNTGTPTAYHTLEVPAQIIGGRTFVPIRHILEAVGYRLEWQSATRTVAISSDTGRAVSFSPFLDWTDNSTSITNERLAEMVASGEIPANVTHLVLSGHRISDVTPLANLTSLVELHLVGNQIRDISPLSKLTNLRALDLSFNPIGDVTPLSNLVNLRELGLFNTENSFSDISSLSRLVRLERFYLSADGSQFDGNIAVISNFTNLRHLGLWSENTTDFSPIGTLVNLEALDLSSAFHLHDLTILENMTNVTHLSIHGAHQIQDFSPLGRFTRLRSLSLQGVPLGNDGLRLLENFTELTVLTLTHNQISDIAPLSNLTNLWLMFLTDNQVSNISPLSGLVNLQTLMLSNNQITDILPLLNLTNLGGLFLDGNPISSAQIAELRNALSLIQLEY